MLNCRYTYIHIYMSRVFSQKSTKHERRQVTKLNSIHIVGGKNLKRVHFSCFVTCNMKNFRRSYLRHGHGLTFPNNTRQQRECILRWANLVCFFFFFYLSPL